ncbi:hypothetical protein CTT31_18195 [Pseudoalteromonas maricaloris]|nr:hypothetical protein CTT31_18195 [Pseudoalteromonas flavipulchra]
MLNSDYTNKRYRKLLKQFGMRASMGARCDSAVAEKFFGSLKQAWFLKFFQSTHEYIKNDVAD